MKKIKYLDFKGRVHDLDVPPNHAVKIAGELTKGDKILSPEFHKFVSWEEMGKPEGLSASACALVITPIPK